MRDNIVFSLTTIPDRINDLRPTLDSLLNHTFPVKEIVIALPDFCVKQKKLYIIPDYLRSYAEIKILKCIVDWGPATKLIPVIFECKELGLSDLNIIVVDDDIIYDPNMVLSFMKYLDHYPNCALSLRGGSLTRFGVHPLTHGSCVVYQPHEPVTDEPIEVDIITGVGGYLVKPSFFDADIAHYQDAPPEARWVDDDWVSGYLAKKNIKKLLIPCYQNTKWWKWGGYEVNTAQNGTPGIGGWEYHRRRPVLEYYRGYWKTSE